MSRIFRALVISAVATSTAVVISALVKNREMLSGQDADANTKKVTEPGKVAGVANDLSAEEEEILLSELQELV